MNDVSHAVIGFLVAYFVVDVLRGLARWRRRTPEEWAGKPPPKDFQPALEVTMLMPAATVQKLNKMQQRCELGHPLLVITRALSVLHTLHNLSDDGYDKVVAMRPTGEEVEIEI